LALRMTIAAGAAEAFAAGRANCTSVLIAGRASFDVTLNSLAIKDVYRDDGPGDWKAQNADD
jgi:hypothetical protein